MVKIYSQIIFFLVSLSLFSQNDPVLFSVNDTDVRLSEFDYIYSKNNGDSTLYEVNKLEDYLDLYIDFKLKVERAKELKLDTLQAFRSEYEDYKTILNDNFVMENNVKNRIKKELYDRMNKEVAIKHILIKLPPRRSLGQENRALERMQKIKQKLSDNGSFEDLVREYSEDKPSIAKGGFVGHISAPLPDAYFELENAIYSTPIGQISEIIKTKMGFHIIKVEGVRPARGKIQVAHILVRKSNESNVDPAKGKIDDIYEKLENGIDFDDLVSQYSEDRNTNSKGGVLPEFSSGTFHDKFENAAFSLKNNGDYSKPVETELGYHIIKRINATPLGSYDEMLPLLDSYINSPLRINRQKTINIESTKSKEGYKFYKNVLTSFIEQIDSNFFQFGWEIPKIRPEQTIAKIGKTKYHLDDFAVYCLDEQRERAKNFGSKSIEALTLALYDAYIEKNILAYNNERLHETYPEFNHLLREYREGILLFEVTKKEIWEKASKDTAQLRKCYLENKDKYQYKTRAKVSRYTVRSTDQSQVDEIFKAAARSNIDQVLKKFNTIENKLDLVLVEERTYENLEGNDLKFKWIAGSITPPKFDYSLKLTKFDKVEKILPPRVKSFDESKGLVISDYQSKLEKQWIESLRKKYKVKVQKKHLGNLVK